MPRPRSQRIHDLKLQLLQRLEQPLMGPGERFLSARAIALNFHVSYQTADRLLAELVADGRLERRQGSGTYIPGQSQPSRSVVLCFHRRAERAESFGDRLLKLLAPRLQREGIDSSTRFVDPGRAARLPKSVLPVLWEAPGILEMCIRQHRPAVLINDRVQPGLQSRFVDSVSVDDFAGGVYAAQLLLTHSPPSPRFAILAGPPDDPRSRDRVEGFRSAAPARIVHATSWYLDAGLDLARQVVRAGTDGIFCCNDRLAEAVILWCLQNGCRRPRIVGFDDAPVAQRLDLSTIAVPWSELAAAVVDAISRRIAQADALATRQLLTPRPVIRTL